MLVSSFNLSQSFIYTPLLFYKKWFKSEINSFCIWTLYTLTSYNVRVYMKTTTYYHLYSHNVQYQHCVRIMHSYCIKKCTYTIEKL
jgi:hypothetical protein